MIPFKDSQRKDHVVYGTICDV